MIAYSPVLSESWVKRLSDYGIPFEDVRVLVTLGGDVIVYFTTSNQCVEEFIETLAHNKGLPPLLLATDKTHHIWSFEI